LPAKGQIEAFDDGIQLSHVYVLGVIRAQPRRVFHDRAADFQRYADCQRAGVYPNFGFFAETSHLPRAGSRFFTASAVSWISPLSSSPSITSSQLVVASLAFLLMYAAAILSHPQTGKWLTSFPQYENTERRVNTSGTPPTSLSRLHISFPRSPQTFSPRRRAPSAARSWVLHVSP
ncbi:hypothetical protein T07_11681, partial [Trichinella nelsoni]